MYGHLATLLTNPHTPHPHTNTQSVRAVIVVHASANDHEILVTICDDFECGRGGGQIFLTHFPPSLFLSVLFRSDFRLTSVTRCWSKKVAQMFPKVV